MSESTQAGDPEVRVEVAERGANGQSSNRRLFMQLQAFGGCAEPKALAGALERSQIEAVLYADFQDPCGVAVLAFSEDPAFFVTRLREVLGAEPFASLDTIVRARVVRDVVALVEREKIGVLLVTHDLEEALSLSDEVYLLSQGPRAHITQQYPVPIPRPRDPVHSRMHPAFSPLYERLWADLSREVDHRVEAA